MAIESMKVGDVYHQHDGDIVILAVNGWRSVDVEFIESGYRRTCITTHILNGNVRDRFKRTKFGVGFLGGDKHKTFAGGKSTKAYVTWSNMLKRCYDESSKSRYPTYFGRVVVCDSWHNFQNFCEWFSVNYPEDGNDYELDKDIINKSALIYSPETCSFVTRVENVREASAKEYALTDPSGSIIKVKNMRKFCLEIGADPSAMTKVAKGMIKVCKGYTPPRGGNESSKI